MFLGQIWILERQKGVDHGLDFRGGLVLEDRPPKGCGGTGRSR